MPHEKHFIINEFKVTFLNAKNEKHHLRLYEALEKWREVIFRLIIEYFVENGGKTNELFYDIQLYFEETVTPIEWVRLYF